MISILVSNFNLDVRRLVGDLHSQAECLGVEVEIVVAEDGSDRFVQENSEITSLQGVRHIVSPQNRGRATTRNALAREAKHRYLLFLDADSEVIDESFLSRYLDVLSENCVINGGIRYRESDEKPEYSLRLRYGHEREEASAKERQRQILSFTTFNMLIDKCVFEKIKFDEEISNYGYEDLVFGYELKRSGYHIQHTDNPLYHTGLDTNSVFLQKTETAIENLKYVYRRYPEVARYSRILGVCRKIERYRLAALLRPMLKALEPCFRRNLLSEQPSLKVFDLYKLGKLLAK